LFKIRKEKIEKEKKNSNEEEEEKEEEDDDEEEKEIKKSKEKKEDQKIIYVKDFEKKMGELINIRLKKESDENVCN
jgi:hypothetical protein